MVMIDNFTFYLYAVVLFILFVLITMGFFGSKKKYLKKGITNWITNTKPQKLIFLNFMLFVCIFIIAVGIRFVVSTLDMSSMKNNLTDCDKIIIKDVYHDFKDNKNKQAEIEISEANIKNEIISFIISSYNKRVLSKSLYYHTDYIEINTIQNNVSTGNYILTCDRLASLNLGVKVYSLNDEAMLQKIRKHLFPERLQTWPKK